MDGSLQISPIPADASMWPYVRDRLRRVEQQMGDAALPERVYGEWVTGRATVCSIRWNGDLSGVIVLTGPEVTGSMKKRIWVWALAVDEVASPEMRLAINDWLSQAARKVGASAVGMASPREGWGRYLKSLGWRPVQVEYELEVNRG